MQKLKEYIDMYLLGKLDLKQLYDELKIMFQNDDNRIKLEQERMFKTQQTIRSERVKSLVRLK